MNPELLIPLAAIIMPFLIPIVVILVKHQQKMAELYALQARTASPEVEALRNDVQELKQLVAQQTINLDNLAGIQMKMLEQGARNGQADLQSRIQQGNQS